MTMSSVDSAIDLSVVVLSWNTSDYVCACLQALRAGGGTLTVEVIVIDNASEDGSADRIAREFPEARLFRNETNCGYALGVNQGLRLARGRKLCILGSDTEVAPDALPTLARFLDEHPRVGAVAPRLLNFDGTIQRAGMRFPTLWTACVWDTALGQTWLGKRELARYQMKDWDHRGTRKLPQPPGTCLMLPRKVVEEIGLMDGRLWLFFNDVDWMKRLNRAGYEAWYLDEAEVKHHLGGSTRRFLAFAEMWHKNRIVYYRKHHGWLGGFVAKVAARHMAARHLKAVRKAVTDDREYEAHAEQIRGVLREILAMDANPAPLPGERLSPV